MRQHSRWRGNQRRGVLRRDTTGSNLNGHRRPPANHRHREPAPKVRLLYTLQTPVSVVVLREQLRPFTANREALNHLGQDRLVMLDLFNTDGLRDVLVLLARFGHLAQPSDQPAA